MKPWVGASWEGWVIHQILFHLKARGESFEAYYLRTSGGDELDLILFFSKGCWAFEIKLSTAPGPEDFRKLSNAADLIGAQKRILLSRTPRTLQGDSGLATNLTHCLEIL